jgi:hypothetical protein
MSALLAISSAFAVPSVIAFGDRYPDFADQRKILGSTQNSEGLKNQAYSLIFLKKSF